MDSFFQWWLAAPRWLRFAISFAVLGFCALLLTEGKVFITGWIFGVFLFFVSFPRPIGRS